MSRAVILMLVAGLAACSTPPPPPVNPVIVGTIDGLYRGTSTRYQADSRNCPHPGLVTFNVLDRSFRYRLTGTLAVDVTVTPEGVVSGRTDDFTLTGEWNGTKIEGDVVGITCALHYRAIKR